MVINKIKITTFGAGCFWHVEEEFRKLDGVIETTVGYMGGSKKNPSYEDVCTDKTGYVEVCQIKFNPDIIQYINLLKTFWRIHNPTQVNRQGPDIGSQYKSIIFYHDISQKSSAIDSKKKEQLKYKQDIATEIISAKTFYKAEEYHQKYLKKRKLSTC